MKEEEENKIRCCDIKYVQKNNTLCNINFRWQNAVDQEQVFKFMDKVNNLQQKWKSTKMN